MSRATRRRNQIRSKECMWRKQQWVGERSRSSRVSSKAQQSRSSLISGICGKVPYLAVTPRRGIAAPLYPSKEERNAACSIGRFGRRYCITDGAEEASVHMETIYEMIIATENGYKRGISTLSFWAGMTQMSYDQRKLRPKKWFHMNRSWRGQRTRSLKIEQKCANDGTAVSGVSCVAERMHPILVVMT